MRRLKPLSVFFLLAWIAGTGGACAGPDVGGDTLGVDGFLHAVYARYAADGVPLNIDDPNAATVYEASLLAMMRADRRALQGEAGVLDADPLCTCQEHDIRAVKWVLETDSANGRSARVSFENLGRTQHVVLVLAHTRQGWRVANVRSENIPSLRASLQDEVRAATQGTAQPATR